MHITDVIPYILSEELDEPFAFSQGWVHKRSAVIVEVQTDEGITGWGESVCQGLQPPEPTAALIRYSLKPLVMGRNVDDVEVLWEEMYAMCRQFGQAGIAINAISGVDIAIWDAIGRAAGKPICKLIGGAFRTRVRPYATGFYHQQGKKYPDAGVDEALRHVKMGLSAMKVKIGFGLEYDLSLIYAVRDAVGPDVVLMADANGGYNVGLAKQLLRESERACLFFLEEPLAPEDRQGYTALRFLSSTYIAAGENLFGKMGYRDWIAEGALDILQPDLCMCGGFTEAKKIAAIAEAYSTPVVPHVWGTAIGLAASLQLIASLPPIPWGLRPDDMWLEFDQSDHPFRQRLIDHGIAMVNGMVQIPTGPGIGVGVNREAILEYAKTERT